MIAMEAGDIWSPGLAPMRVPVHVKTRSPDAEGRIKATMYGYRPCHPSRDAAEQVLAWPWLHL